MSGTASRATPSTVARNEAVAMSLPADDGEDLAEARRGFVAELSPALIRATDGRVVWDADSYSFLQGECPETVNPSLWRQSLLNAICGLFEVAPGIYQVRGLDISNMTIVEGYRGVLVIDPLISAETAAAALALYREHRGDRPVTGLLYTHSHVDHFGGAGGIVSSEQVASGEVPVLAPEGFCEHAVAENVHAGVAMVRRGGYMFGRFLERGPAGHLGTGLGLTASTGEVTLVPPTLEISRTGQSEEVDGIRMRFQLTPDTEAPAEMNFSFPGRGVLCIAENATHNLHNVITPRGAAVRDARAWSRYLDDAIEIFGGEVEVMFAGHHWPRWGSERIVEFLSTQRDLYGYLHDQTLRLINKGYVGAEIAEALELPPSLARHWHCRGYYGSVSHNVKGIYQRYMGWFDGDPAHLWEHPPAESARRYVELIGGAEAVLAAARSSFEEGDYRWVAQLAGKLVLAEPGNADARELEAQALEQLAYGAENAVWRNFFLTGAKELREGVAADPAALAPPGVVANLSTEQLLDSVAIRIDGPRAQEARIVLNLVLTDRGERHVVRLANGVLTHRPAEPDPEADVTVEIERSAIDELLGGRTTPEAVGEAGRGRVIGDAGALAQLAGLLDAPDPAFPIVTSAAVSLSNGA